MAIKQPKNKKISFNSTTAELKFNTNFSDKWNGRLKRAQIVVDSEVLTRCERYTPLLTGTLIKSGILGTVFGSGVVQWITPYAKRQYYKGRIPGTQQAGPLRGRYWFERMKAVEKRDIVKKANEIFGGNGTQEG